MYNDVIMWAEAYLVTSKSALLVVCVFVCERGYLKKLWTNSDEAWWTGLLCDKDELIRFW